MSSITFSNLNISPITHTLSPLSVTVMGGTILYITGHNGIGKTTALKSIAGLNDDGVMVSGQYVSSPIYRMNVCYIPDHTNMLNGTLTILEELSFWAKICGQRNEMLIGPSLVTLGIQHLADQTICTLSRGTKAKVNLCRAMISLKDVWILDEPFVHIDTAACDIVEELIMAHCNAGKIAIFASHIVSDRIKSNSAIINLEDHICEEN